MSNPAKDLDARGIPMTLIHRFQIQSGQDMLVVYGYYRRARSKHEKSDRITISMKKGGFCSFTTMSSGVQQSLLSFRFTEAQRVVHQKQRAIVAEEYNV